ncbi:MAG: hypothetical protein AAFV19_19625 [Pseudomonadota bacterium]
MDREGIFQIGKKLQGERTAVAEMPTAYVLQSLEKDGLFSSLSAHGLIVLTYALWDERYRSLIAKELGEKEKNAINCDVMGDVRTIRKWIVHNQSTATKSGLAEMKSLRWPKEPGPFQFTGDRMEDLQHAINTMHVWLKD